MYSDHYSLFLVLKYVPVKPKVKPGKKRKVIWNTKREGAWQKYYEKTNSNEEFENLVIDSNKIDVNMFDNKIDKLMTKCKFSCFGKVSIPASTKEEREIISIQKEKLVTSVNVHNIEKVQDIDSRLAMAISTANERDFEKKEKSILKTLVKIKIKVNQPQYLS